MQNTIQVKWADNESDRLGIRQDQDHVLYVAHIPKVVNEKEIRNVFENYGIVKEVDIPKDQGGYSRGYIFVKLDNIEQAILAKQALHEKQILSNSTQPLVVKFYDPKKKQSTNQQGQQNTGGNQNMNMNPNSKTSSSSSNPGNYGNQPGGHHHTLAPNRDNNPQSNYHNQQQQFPPQQNQQQNGNSGDNYGYQRDINNNHNQPGNYSNNQSQQQYRGNYQNQYDNKRGHNAPNNQGNYPQREGTNLSGSGNYEPNQSYEGGNVPNHYQGHPPNFRDQQPQQYGNQNQQQGQGFPNQNRGNGIPNNNNNNYQYNNTHQNNQPTGNNTNYQYNQMYNPSTGNDYNQQNQQINDYAPPPQGQNNFPYQNDYQTSHNNGPPPNNMGNQQGGYNQPPYYHPQDNPDPQYQNTHQPNNDHSYNNTQNINNNQNQQIPYNDQHQNGNNNMQHQQQNQQDNNPQNQQYQQQTTSSLQTSNEPSQVQPQAQKTYIKYYTDDKIPYYYDTQEGTTSYDVPPLGSLIYNSDGTQEHVLPESIEQLQKFQQETGLSENKELDILSQKTTGPPGANLFIFHLPNDYRDSDLLRLFKKFGDLLSARVITRPDGTSKGYGFVSYTHPDGAQQAIQNMNGLQVGKKKLKVEVKKELGDKDFVPGMNSNFQPF